MVWPDGAWLLSKLLSNKGVRVAASFSLLLATLGFAAGGVGLLLQGGWQRSVIEISTVFSILLFSMFWDGKYKALDDQGGIGVLINLVFILIILIFGFPG